MTASSKDSKMRSPGHGGTSATGDGAVMGAVPDPFGPLRERGISDPVREARGYVPYYGKNVEGFYDPGTVRRELEPYGLTPGQRSTTTRFTNAAVNELGEVGRGDGLLMRKHPVPGAPPVPPQLRPRYAVPTGGKIFHRHSTAFNSEHHLQRHLANDHQDDAADVAPDALHWHDKDGKYLMMSNAKEAYEHSHATDQRFQGLNGARMLRQHVRARSGHNGARVDWDELHTHRRDVPGQHVADRLDIHPWALAQLHTAQIIYFVIEGTPKADAILTQILHSGTQASVFNVPSVTLWKAPELRDFAKTFLSLKLRRTSKPLVVVVPDADWHSNEQVVRQALLCREYLRKLGVDCCVAAPTSGDHECSCPAGVVNNAVGRCARCDGFFKGVDDYHAAGGRLESLTVVDREAPHFSLALHAEPDGTISRSIWGLGDILGVRHAAESIVAELERYMQQGWVMADRPLMLMRNEYSGLLEWEHGRPVFTVRDDLRYTERFLPLRDYAPQHEESRPYVLSNEIRKAKGEAVFHNTRHIAAAIASTAELQGVSPDAVRKTFPGLAEATRKDQRALVHSYIHAPSRPTDEQIAADLSITVRDVRRMAKEPCPDWERQIFEMVQLSKIVG
jgi:hypothetical protein